MGPTRTFCVVAVMGLALGSAGWGQEDRPPGPPGHPMDPLTRDEYRRTAEILRQAGRVGSPPSFTPSPPTSCPRPTSWRGGPNRSIAGTDIVLWYTLGFRHIAAAEDWPVLPTKWRSVVLRPFNFFDHNPAINLRRPTPGDQAAADRAKSDG